MMRHVRARLLAVGASTALVTGLLAGTAGTAGAGTSEAAPASSQCPWLESHASAQVKADEVLAKMTLGEKISMTASEPANGYTGGYIAPIPRLCIPAFTKNGGPAGVAGGMTGVTQLPAPIAGAATWDTSLMKQYGTVVGTEEYGKGVDVTGGPTVNIDRVPEWGRTFESLGEDPYLTSQLTVADVDGIQSTGEMAMVKHFDAYNQETNRNTSADDVIVSDRVLHEMYMPAFQAAVQDAHVDSVMCAYSIVNGQYSCQNPYLLTTVLRDQWGFTGPVISDSGAIHSTVAAADAGADVEMASQSYFGATEENAVEDGQVSMATLNAQVYDILYAMFRSGIFAHPPTGTPASVVTTAAHADVARRVAEQSAVLLKNSDDVLPLNTSAVHSIAVIGADASTAPITAGGGSAHVNAPYVVTPLQGITSRAGSGVTITYAADGQAAVQAAASADVAIVFAGQNESEGADLANLELPGDDNQLISEVAAANPNTIVVLNTGSPATMPWLDQVKGVIEDWYPGQEDGNAIASVLFGDVDPSGHLPVTFPTSDTTTPVQSAQQWPGENGEVDYSEGLDVGYRWYDANDVAPLFPFGYGLSYTTFKFSGLNVARSPGTSLGSALVTATITNTGDRAGAEVAQLYVGDPASAGEPPRQLKGFQKVTLKPGQSARLHFTLTGQDLSYYDSTAGTWVEPTGSYQIYVGDSSALAGLPLRGQFSVAATTGTRHVTLAAPGDARAGTPFTVTATLTAGGNMAVQGTRLSLAAPAGWKIKPASRAAAGSLSASRALTASWQVTVPASRADNIGSLTATATYHGAGGSGTQTAGSQVTVAPSVTSTVTPSTVLLPGSGQASTAVLTNTDTSGYPVRISWRADPSAGSGITVTPASGTATLTPGATTTSSLSIASTTVGTFEVPVSVTVTGGGTRQSSAGAYLEVTTPYSSLAAAYNNVGISDDSDPTAGHFGVNSWSAEALAAAGIVPGGTVSSPDGLSYTWPDVPVATEDNVAMSGQTIAISGSGTELGFLGAANDGTHAGTVTVTYTDGSTSTATLTQPDWFADTAPPGGAVVATLPYINTPSGRRDQTVGLYSSTIPVDPGKTVMAVQLPVDTDMHVFAMAFG